MCILFCYAVEPRVGWLSVNCIEIRRATGYALSKCPYRPCEANQLTMFIATFVRQVKLEKN